MTAIDGTGLKALEDFADAVHGSGRALLLCGAPGQPSPILTSSVSRMQDVWHIHV